MESKKLTTEQFDDGYKEICFRTWYAAGRPPNTRAVELLPPDEFGRKPAVATFDKWRTGLLWDFRADDLDTRAIAIADEDLVLQKVEMLKRHADEARRISDSALTMLLKDGFDSSASAVNAYFRATEQEQKARGISELISKMSKMTNEELQEKIRDMLRRGNENDQIVEVVDTESKENDTE